MPFCAGHWRRAPKGMREHFRRVLGAWWESHLAKAPDLELHEARYFAIRAAISYALLPDGSALQRSVESEATFHMGVADSIRLVSGGMPH